nr:hypothetical protein [Bacilli bacterium]
SLNELIQLADKALYRGKFKGKNCYIIYDPALHKNIDTNLYNRKLSNIALLKYIYNMFTLHEDTLDALENAVEFIANYFHDNYVVFQDSRGEYKVLADNDNENEGSYIHIKPEYYNLSPYQTHLMVYLRDLETNHVKTPLIEKMKESHIRTSMVYRLKDIYGEKAYLFVHERRDKIWSEEEEYAYETLIHLFSLINKRERK